MRRIKRKTQFKRDYKREARGRYRTTLDDGLKTAVSLLMADAILPERFHDHALTGNWRDFRDCHIKPDLVLIYRKQGDDILELVRLGSHSELSL